MKKAKLELIKKVLRAENEKPKKVKGMLSTGNTLLNLACSSKWFGGFARGKYYLVVGDSSSGKTFLSLTCFAEACINPKYEDYELIFDDVEGGALMDIERFFGKRVAERLEPPSRDEEGNAKYSQTAEEFYYHLKKAAKRARSRGKGFIYVLDSENALTSEAARGKFEEKMEAHDEGKETAGSYGDAKAKIHSECLRDAVADLRDTNSILIIISQTRDNLGFGFEKKTRSGGRALKFYATLEMWSSIKEKIKKTVKGKLRTVGIVAQVQIKKNRFTGKDRTVEIPIYHAFGFDDTGACVDYLLEEKHWKSKKGVLEAPEFNFSGSREDLIKQIEETNSERQLRELAGMVWKTIEEECERAVARKARYV
jgi:RecA/RadA recombinase